MEQAACKAEESLEGHDGGLAFVQFVPIEERHDGEPVWQGIVLVFDLKGHAKAKRAYACVSPIEGSDKWRCFAVLLIPPVTSPLEAVRTAITAKRRGSAGG